MKENNIAYIKEKFKDSFDVKYREIKCKEGEINVVFVDTLCDAKFISEYVVTPLVQNDIGKDSIKNIKEIIVSNTVEYIDTVEEAVEHLLSGDVVLSFDFIGVMIYCEAKNFQKRPITSPETENTIKGSRESFNETLVDNISLLRRRIKNPDLKIKVLSVGSKSNTDVALLYMENLAPDYLVKHVENTLKDMNQNFVLYGNAVEERLKAKRTIFDTIGYSEKPEIICSKLLEGRVVVVVDGTPSTVYAPFFFLEFFQVSEDYGLNKYYTNLNRLVRSTTFILAVFLPGLFVALTTNHISLIPTDFVFRLAISRSGVPFPTIVEVFLMLIFFSISREAGLRLPPRIGPALSIVSGIILGDAAVGAGLASQSTLVVVGISSLSSLVHPKMFGPISLWSIIIIVFSTVLGFPGFYTGFMAFVTHICGLNTCGYPYVYPLGTLKRFKYDEKILRGDLNKISNSLFKKDDKK